MCVRRREECEQVGHSWQCDAPRGSHHPFLAPSLPQVSPTSLCKTFRGNFFSSWPCEVVCLFLFVCRCSLDGSLCATALARLWTEGSEPEVAQRPSWVDLACRHNRSQAARNSLWACTFLYKMSRWVSKFYFWHSFCLPVFVRIHFYNFANKWFRAVNTSIYFYHIRPAVPYFTFIEQLFVHIYKLNVQFLREYIRFSIITILLNLTIINKKRLFLCNKWTNLRIFF